MDIDKYYYFIIHPINLYFLCLYMGRRESCKATEAHSRG